MLKPVKMGLLTAAMLTASQLSYAAAFQLYELASPINGTAAVGQAAVVDNASIAYYNPAGMALLKRSQVMLGGQMMLPYMNFSMNHSNTIEGTNGGNAAGLAPGVGGYFVYSYSPALKFGLSLTTPYAGAMNYDSHWVGRYSVQQLLLYAINLNPSVAYKLNDWVSLGGGFSMEYANLFQTVALPLVPGLDGQLTVKTDSLAYGVNAGVLFTPRPSTQMGVAFRSQIVHKLRGRSTFYNISATPDVSTKMVMPSNVIASLSQRMTEKLTMLGELGWSDWSSMKNTSVTIRGLSATTPQDWNNTYRVGLGGLYQISPRLIYQLGTSYDSSPTTSSRRSPNLPMDRQIRVGTGVEYLVTQAVKLAVSYEYINFGNANMNNTSNAGTFAGSYSRNYANVVQASANVEL